MAKHHSFRFDSTDTPTQNTESIDHRRMAVGADQRVRHPYTVLLTRNTCNPLQIHLMDDATAGGNCTEIVEALLSPLEELVALHIALIFDFQIAFSRIGEKAGYIDLNRVVNDQIDGDLRIDLLWIATQRHHGVA